MRLTCPRCATAYELDDRLIPSSGAAVQCTRCSLVWQSPGPHQVSIPGVEAPPELLERLGKAPHDPGVWKVVEDWLLEQPAMTSQLNTSHLFQTTAGLTLHTHRRCGLATRGTVSTLDYHPPAPAALAAPLRSSELAVLYDLRVRATWPPRPALVEGAPMTNPQTVIPTLVEQVLDFAPPRLTRLAIWLDANPGWGPKEDCLSQLEPLTRLRPSSATHLELRAPTRGLLKLLRPVARRGWRSITVRAPFSVEELAALSELAAARPDVDFHLMRMADTPTPEFATRNLRWVDDSERMTVSVEGADGRWELEPNSPWLPNELASRLAALCLDLKGDLGLWEFRRGSDAARDDHVTVNGLDVRAPMPARSGERYHVSFQSSRVDKPSGSQTFVFG